MHAFGGTARRAVAWELSVAVWLRTVGVTHT
jgi:hypothetical protein